jgi:ribonuclease E
MEESKNNRAVEKRMKDCLRYDRARVQNNKISMFGLMEISRQRRRAGVLDSSSDPCDCCAGTGHVRSVDSAALQLLRALENRCAGLESGNVEATAPTDVVLFLLNEKRHSVAALEERHNIRVQISARTDLLNGDFEIRVTDNDGEIVEAVEPKYVPPPRIYIPDDPEEDDEENDDAADGEVAETEKSESTSSSTGRRRRRRRRGSSDDAKSSDNLKVLDDPQGAGDNEIEENSGPSDFGSSEDDDSSEDSASRKRRRRGRRGGRRRRGRDNDALIELHDEIDTIDGGAVLDETASDVIALLPEGTELIAKAEVSESAPAEVESATPEEAVTEAESSEAITEPVAEADTSQEAAPVSGAAEEIVSETITESNPVIEPEPVEALSETAAEPDVQPDPATAEDAVSIELPETEKPKTVKRGWWSKRSGN